MRYRDKPLTFIDHDGVPWNNQHAENAIETPTQHREQTVGMVREGGLSDYLTLLSLRPTSRYKG